VPLVRRILWAAIVVWLTATAAFIALRLLPGDAIAAQLMDSGADAAAIQARRDALGLNDPWTVQYIRFLAGLLRGDLGESLIVVSLSASLSPLTWDRRSRWRGLRWRLLLVWG